MAFQNCGETNRSVGIFADQSAQFWASENCEYGRCDGSAELLWMRIREYEPYKVNHGVATSLGYFTVGGQCGIGHFPSHYFEWNLREGFGGQNVIASGTANNLCDLGQFQVPIFFEGATPQVNQRYQLTVEIVGVTFEGEHVINPMPTNSSRLDVLFMD